MYLSSVNPSDFTLTNFALRDDYTHKYLDEESKENNQPD